MATKFQPRPQTLAAADQNSAMPPYLVMAAGSNLDHGSQTSTMATQTLAVATHIWEAMS